MNDDYWPIAIILGELLTFIAFLAWLVVTGGH